jgi:hypothetical protein
MFFAWSETGGAAPRRAAETPPLQPDKLLLGGGAAAFFYFLKTRQSFGNFFKKLKKQIQFSMTGLKTFLLTCPASNHTHTRRKPSPVPKKPKHHEAKNHPVCLRRKGGIDR